ncbi:uncharacterized protein [Physcomitrium patens]|uniref:uncharacterized protein isoform X2 n=1 Tax=Physcomitrium patens TaxID=3218 RepID=UPI003CCD4844
MCRCTIGKQQPRKPIIKSAAIRYKELHGGPCPFHLLASSNGLELMPQLLRLRAVDGVAEILSVKLLEESCSRQLIIQPLTVREFFAEVSMTTQFQKRFLG